MTLLASWIGRDRALVAADTRITLATTDSAVGRRAAREVALAGGAVEGSKLLAMPHARLVLAHSGSTRRTWLMH